MEISPAHHVEGSSLNSQERVYPWEQSLIIIAGHFVYIYTCTYVGTSNKKCDTLHALTTHDTDLTS